MNFHYSTYICNTTYRPQNYHSSHFNEDAHCDNEVNLILDKNYNQQLIEQSKEKVLHKEQQSLVINQTNQYYFMPIREQNSTTILTGNNVTDNKSLLPDLQHPSALNLFDDSLSNYFSSSILNMNSSDTTTTTTTVNKPNNNYSLSDADLAALFLSSITTTTPSPQTITPNALIDNIHQNNNNNNNETSNNALDDVFLNQFTDLTCSSPTIIDKPQPIGPPPGFENFRLDSSSSSSSDLLLSQTTNKNSTLSSISNAVIQTPVSSSDTINFSQLLQSTAVDTQQQQQQPIVNNVGNIRSSSSSSHLSFTSDEQSIFFPMSTHPYSSSILHSTSQIFSTNSPSSPTITSTTNNSAAKPHIPNSLSLSNNNNNNNNHYFSTSSAASILTSSTTDSPITITAIENDKRINDGGMTPNHIFTSTDSFFTNGHTDFIPSKPTNNKVPSMNHQSSIATRTSSSSASSSTSSSIDEALIQLTQQQKQIQNANKLFTNEPLSMFHSSTLQRQSSLDKEQQAVHDNISFLASMASASTPITSESTWQQPVTSNSLDSNINLQRKMNTMVLQQPQIGLSQSSSRNNNPTNIHELLQNLNELCYKGFDELNTLIQEQRWVQSYVSLNSPSPTFPSANLNGSNCCSSRILIVPEYFVFKCKKVEITASHVFELLATGRAELRLRDLMFVFKSWKESIINAEIIHQEEENKLRLSTEHPQSYYMTDTVLQAAFDRVSHSIRKLCNLTQQARAAFQYATLNICQALSRQQQLQSQTSSTSIALAQYQAMQQQQKSTTNHRTSGSIRTTP
ncbi:unnamed protein product [Adineta steineri]|uniref:Uncharacterized protein n=2 Tax=Adineta steineri TaxID=433720 RepID=A0A813TQU2_9BILA|nr:unnamed protein product [Adineta steineri]